jgi:hypothetical protein
MLIGRNMALFIWVACTFLEKEMEKNALLKTSRRVEG